MIILTICLSPMNAFAEEDLTIRSWIVESRLMEDGSLSIVKDISYDFNSDFNGIYVDVSLSDYIEIENLQVFQVIDGQEVTFKQDQRARKGDFGVYSTDLKNDNINIMIFSPSENESKTFRLSYSLKNVAIRQANTGEFYFKYIGENNDTTIEYFKANLYLPKFNQDEIKIFAHGPENGNINFDNDSIKLEVSNVPSNTFVEARVLFPLDYIPNGIIWGNISLDEILKDEQALADKIINDQVKRQERKSLLNNLSIGFSAVGLLVLAFIFNKFRRKADLFDDMTSIYPDEISPAELSLFMNSMMVPRAYLATLLDLARRQFISFEAYTSDSETNRKSKKSESSDYIFTRRSMSGNLMEHENFFLDWFFDEIGDGSKVTTIDIDNYREKNGSKFYKAQTNWSKIVKNELNKRDYFDTRGNKYGTIALILGFILLSISVVSLVFEGLLGISLLIISIIIIVYSVFLFRRLNNKGYIQYRLWKDFKKNNDKINLDTLGLSTDLSIIYLIALGLPMKDLDNYRQSIDMSYYPMHWGYYFFLTNSHGGSNFEDKFNNSFYGNSGSSTASSSSFGGGGGFTGGGGGGVGGSGSGGF